MDDISLPDEFRKIINGDKWILNNSYMSHTKLSVESVNKKICKEILEYFNQTSEFSSIKFIDNAWFKQLNNNLNEHYYLCVYEFCMDFVEVLKQSIKIKQSEMTPLIYDKFINDFLLELKEKIKEIHTLNITNEKCCMYCGNRESDKQPLIEDNDKIYHNECKKLCTKQSKRSKSIIPIANIDLFTIKKDFNNYHINKVLNHNINIVSIPLPSPPPPLPDIESIPTTKQSPIRQKSRRKVESRSDNVIDIDLIKDYYNSESDNSDDYIESPRNNRTVAIKRKSNRRISQSQNNYKQRDRLLSTNFSRDGTGFEPLFKLEELIKTAPPTVTTTVSTPANTADQDDREFEFQEHIINQPKPLSFLTPYHIGARILQEYKTGLTFQSLPPTKPPEEYINVLDGTPKMYITESLQGYCIKIIKLITRYCFTQNVSDISNQIILSDYVMGFLYSFEAFIKTLVSPTMDLKRTNYSIFFYLESLFEYLNQFIRFTIHPKDMFYIIRFILLTALNITQIEGITVRYDSTLQKVYNETILKLNHCALFIQVMNSDEYPTLFTNFLLSVNTLVIFTIDQMKKNKIAKSYINATLKKIINALDYSTEGNEEATVESIYFSFYQPSIAILSS